MSQRYENELTGLRRGIIKMQIVGMIAAVCIGLAVYGLFVAKGDAFHPLLNNSELLNTLLVSGIFLEVWHLSKLLPLLKRYAKHKQLKQV